MFTHVKARHIVLAMTAVAMCFALTAVAVPAYADTQTPLTISSQKAKAPKLKAGWNKIDGKWYLANKKGVALKGWQKYKKNKYYLNKKTGVMKTGWLKLGSKKYYLMPGNDGKMVTGWKQIAKAWYYFNKNGVMQTNKWIKHKGGYYFLQKNGKMATSAWIGKYHVNKNGKRDKTDNKRKASKTVTPDKKASTKVTHYKELKHYYEFYGLVEIGDNITRDDYSVVTKQMSVIVTKTALTSEQKKTLYPYGIDVGNIRKFIVGDELTQAQIDSYATNGWTYQKKTVYTDHGITRTVYKYIGETTPAQQDERFMVRTAPVKYCVTTAESTWDAFMNTNYKPAHNGENAEDGKAPVYKEVYRLYNPKTKAYLLSASGKEIYNLETKGWTNQGHVWMSPKTSNIPVWRLNKGNAYIYLTDKASVDSQVKQGWTNQGIVFYGEPYAKSIYHCYKASAPAAEQHIYVATSKERKALEKRGYTVKDTIVGCLDVQTRKGIA